MLLNVSALCEELPGLAAKVAADPKSLTDLLASLGFPVDADTVEGGFRILDVDITANRGDVMSHRGMARDLAAKVGMPLADLPACGITEGAALREVRIEAEACAQYATALLDLARIEHTPEATRAFLGSLGAGAKGLGPVDASNELLHRLGHPTHAFDADRLEGAIVIRWAQDGERLVTLDGVERTLTSRDLVIADARGPVALAGVMGGEGSKVTEATRTVLLESAWFDPRVVRAMARRHGLHTDASHRFGRGADPRMAVACRDLLAHWLMQHNGGTLRGAWSVGACPAARPAVSVTLGTLSRIAGEGIGLEEACGYLEALGCKVEVAGECLAVVPPSWRHDLTLPEDVAEEVLRLRGYDRIPSVLPPLQGEPLPLSPETLQRRQMASRLAHAGFYQCVTLGFVSPESDALVATPDNPAEGRTLANPLGQEYSVMRCSLLPSLADVAQRNLAQGAREVRLFEIGPAYRTSPEGPVEVPTLALLWGGQVGGVDPFTRIVNLEQEGQLHLQGILRDLGLGGEVRAHRLAPTGPNARFWCFEAPLSAFPAQEARVIPRFRGFSRFPAVERDLSLLVDLDQDHAALCAALAGALAPVTELMDFRCVDVFRHKSLPEGKQAWLMRFRFQASDRTLRSEEVDGWVAQALAAAESLGAKLR